MTKITVSDNRSFFTSLKFINSISSKACVFLCPHKVYVQSSDVQGNVIHEMVYGRNHQPTLWETTCAVCPNTQSVVIDLTFMLENMEKMGFDKCDGMVVKMTNDRVICERKGMNTCSLAQSKDSMPWYQTDAMYQRVKSADVQPYLFHLPLVEFAQIRKECGIFGAKMVIERDCNDVVISTHGPNGSYGLRSYDVARDFRPNASSIDKKRRGGVKTQAHDKHTRDLMRVVVETQLIVLCLMVGVGDMISFFVCAGEPLKLSMKPNANTIVHCLVNICKERVQAA